MANFQGVVLGALLTLLGWDGTDFQNVKVDSSGHLQIDVLSNVLGGDQATETTLGAVKDRLGALTTPAAGSVNKLLTDMLTALQLIDDLRGALDSVNTDELVVNVDASVLPSDAATEASLQGIEDAVPDQLIGYAGIYRERVSNTSASAGTNVLSGTSVPANQLYIVKSVATFNDDNNVTITMLYRYGGGSAHVLVRVPSLLADTTLHWQGMLVLEEGESIRAVLQGCTLNDDIYLDIQGWKATI